MTDQFNIKPWLRVYLRVVNVAAVTPFILLAFPVVCLLAGLPHACENLVGEFAAVWRLLESEAEFYARRDRERAAETGKVLNL